MRDYIDLGCAPSHEECAQVGSTNYLQQARKQCRAYIGQLRRELGPEPIGAHLTLRLNPHDFGTYLSVICYFDDEHKESIDYAFKCEGQGPKFWDGESQRELGLDTPTRKEKGS